jgi:predicted TIM-barrel fold metal-dependent hydrolase
MNVSELAMKPSSTAAVASPAIDCDVHPVVNSIHQLVPYLDDYWRDFIAGSRYPDFRPLYHPEHSPIANRPDARVPPDGPPASNVEQLCSDVLDDGVADIAILQCLYAVQLIRNVQLSSVLARATNRWIVEEWLDRDPRLRASLVVPMHTARAAVEEIEFWRDERRFVSLLVPVVSELPYGREVYWPVWQAAVDAGLPVTLHLGGGDGTAPTSAGWPSTYLEWYVDQQTAAAEQLTSMIAGGVFANLPDLIVVCAELGFAWLPPFMWRIDKQWKSFRSEVPWVQELPSEILRRHVRFTVAPLDGTSHDGRFDRTVEVLGSDDMLLFATDYPHWHEEQPARLHEAIESTLIEKIMRHNPASVYRAITSRQPA